MEQMQITVGLDVQLATTIGNIQGKVVRVSEYEDDRQKGTLAEIDVPNYGKTQDFFFNNGMITQCEEERRKSLSRIPVEYKSKYPKDFDFSLYGENTNLQKKIVNDFIINFNTAYKITGRSLYIFSKEKGTGKTMLACILANEIMRRYGISCKYVNSQEYIEMYSSKKTEEVEAMKNCMLLILDDIGAESTGRDNWTQKIIYNLVNWRYVNHYPTIFTSNFPIEELKEDDTTISRLERCIPISIPNVSIRRQNSYSEVKKFIDGIDSKEMEQIFK